MNTIGIFNETSKEIKELEKVNDLLEFAIKREALDNLEFNVIIIDNDRIKELNRKYREINKETDVISFALEDVKDIKYENYRLLGDIYISIDKVYEQAESYEHSVLRELSFLSIHGLLHLLGYNHELKEEEEVMFKKQEDILNEYGITR